MVTLDKLSRILSWNVINQLQLCKRNGMSQDLPRHTARCILTVMFYTQYVANGNWLSLEELYSTSSQPYKSLHTSQTSRLSETTAMISEFSRVWRLFLLSNNSLHKQQFIVDILFSNNCWIFL